MRNILKPVPVDLGGAQVELKYDWNAVAEIQESMGGLDVFAGANDPNKTQEENAAESAAQMESLMRRSGAKHIRTFVWAGVLHMLPGITAIEVGQMMDFDRMADIGAAVTKAMAEHIGGGAKGDAEKPANPPGPVAVEPERTAG